MKLITAVQRHTGDPLVLVAFAAVDGMVDILEEGFMVTWFGDQQERKAPCAWFFYETFTGRMLDLDERLLGVKAVGDDNCRHPGIVGAEPLASGTGIDFAILLMVLAASAVTVEYELGSEGEHYALVRMHDGGLQDVMMMALDVCGGARQRSQLTSSELK